jgi:hypothetical protein
MRAVHVCLYTYTQIHKYACVTNAHKKKAINIKGRAGYKKGTCPQNTNTNAQTVRRTHDLRVGESDKKNEIQERFTHIFAQQEAAVLQQRA